MTDTDLDHLAALLAKRAGQTPAEASRILASLDQLLEEDESFIGRRWQDKAILDLVPEGARILDLGCGAGTLLSSLIKSKKARGQGVELDHHEVAACVERGVPVLQADIDEGLAQFADQSFDLVILEETLQTLYKPDRVLEEMLRVGLHGIVSFPNAAHWRARLHLALRGTIPVTRSLPYAWYNTPNIHPLTLKDFLLWAEERRVEIVSGMVLTDTEIRPFGSSDDNLMAAEVLFVLRRRAWRRATKG